MSYDNVRNHKCIKYFHNIYFFVLEKTEKKFRRFEEILVKKKSAIKRQPTLSVGYSKSKILIFHPTFHGDKLDVYMHTLY